MPAYQLHIYEQQEEREVLEQKICEQVDACTEVNGTIRNRIKKFLIEEGITDISEMDAVLRVRCEEYLERNETVLAPITCLRGSDERRTADTGREKKLYYRVSGTVDVP